MLTSSFLAVGIRIADLISNLQAKLGQSVKSTLVKMENRQYDFSLVRRSAIFFRVFPLLYRVLKTKFGDNQLKLHLQAISKMLLLGEPKSTPSWQRSSRSSTEIPQRWRKTSLIISRVWKKMDKSSKFLNRLQHFTNESTWYQCGT